MLFSVYSFFYLVERRFNNIILRSESARVSVSVVMITCVEAVFSTNYQQKQLSAV